MNGGVMGYIWYLWWTCQINIDFHFHNVGLEVDDDKEYSTILEQLNLLIKLASEGWSFGGMWCRVVDLISMGCPISSARDEKGMCKNFYIKENNN